LNIALTFDLEKDANLPSTYGISIGLKKILKILEKYSIKSTFFVTSYIAQKFPEVIKKLSKDNEIASHGHIHKKYYKINESEKKGIENSKLLLEKITGKEVIGFRAPMLYTNLKLYKTLNELSFKYDASGKPNSKISSYGDLKILNVSPFNFFVRIPIINKLFQTKFFQNQEKNSLSVLYFHPWEAIDMKKIYFKRKNFKDLFFRPDRWVNTGETFLKTLENLIQYFLSLKFQFLLLRDILINAQS